jgi:DNA repair exonuclease SbcCD nuclease subunit
VKIVVFSDLHIHDWQEHSTDKSRLHHGISVLRQVREYSIKNGVHAVLFGGDLFHKRGVLYTLPYNLVVAELALWREAHLPLYANVGNHDAADRLAKVHALSALESAGLLRTVDADGWATWEIVSDQGDVVVSAVAYCSDAAELRRRTDAALTDRKNKLHGEFTIGLFHHGFRGARVGTSLEYVVKEDSDPDAYAKSFDLMISGHYHAHQEIGTHGNAWYVGSPMEFVRGETSPKGFLMLDTVKAEMERITLGLPRFVKLTPEQIVDEDFDMREHVKGNFVDVVFDELPMPWESIDSVLRNLGALGTRACPTQAATLPKSSRLQIDLTMGDRQLLEAYLEHVAVDPSEREDLLRVGLSLIEEASK